MRAFAFLESSNGALEALDRGLGAQRGLLGTRRGGFRARSGGLGPTRAVVVCARDPDGDENENRRDHTHDRRRYAACAGPSNPGGRGVTARRAMTTVRDP